MKRIGLVLLLFTMAAQAADENQIFRGAATQYLLERTLPLLDKGAYICFSIDNASPNDEQIKLLRELGASGIGPPENCACSTDEHFPRDICVRVGSSQSACSISLSDFQIKAPNKASATVTHSCGWPDGGTEIVNFEKGEKNWYYVGEQGRIVW